MLLSILGAMPSAASQGILWGIMAIGAYITYRILNFSDLTVDGSFALGGCVSAFLVSSGWNPFLALLIATIGGVLAGTVTGVLNTKLKIPGILAGILTMISLYSINIRIMGKPNTPIMNEKTVITLCMDKFGLSRLTVTLILGIIFVTACILILYWFFGTEIGCAIRATGNNENMARAQGVDTDHMKIFALQTSNALVALSGALVAQDQRYGDVGMGTGTMVVGLASVVIGSVLIREESSFATRLIATVAGSVIYRAIIAIVLQLGMNSDDQKLLTAIIVASALSIPMVKGKLNMNGKSSKKQEAK